MVRIRLTYRTRLLAVNDARGLLPTVRVVAAYCALHVGPDDACCTAEGLVDTGSPLSIIPQRL